MEPLTALDVEELRQRFKEQSRGTLRLLTPLPRKVRLRLWITGHRDRIACWLAERHHEQAAICLWRVTGGWR